MKIILYFTLLFFWHVSSGALPAVNFRDQMIEKYFNTSLEVKIGPEIELSGLPADIVIEAVRSVLGGEQPIQVETSNGRAWIINHTEVGMIRVESVDLQRFMNDLRPSLKAFPLVANCAECTLRLLDRHFSDVEIVGPPMSYQQILKFSEILDVLSVKGAKGASNLGRFVSFQVNLGVNPKDVNFLRFLLLNYYQNAALIRADTAPVLGRKSYIRMPHPYLIEKLQDLSWDPTLNELYEIYKQTSHPKLSRLNIMNALLMDPLNRSQNQGLKFQKPIVPRPAIEFREANSIFNQEQPNLARDSFLREVKFDMSLYEATKRGVVVAFDESNHKITTRFQKTGFIRCENLFLEVGN